MTPNTMKLEVGRPIYTDDLFKTLSNLDNEGTVRLATTNGSDLFEANVRPHTPPDSIRHCGRFNDYKENEGAVRPTRVNEWAITLVEQAGAARSAGGRG